jgi:hypothetical protein
MIMKAPKDTLEMELEQLLGSNGNATFGHESIATFGDDSSSGASPVMTAMEYIFGGIAVGGALCLIGLPAIPVTAISAVGFVGYWIGNHFA